MVVKREENRKKSGHILVWNQDQLEAPMPKERILCKILRIIDLFISEFEKKTNLSAKSYFALLIWINLLY